MHQEIVDFFGICKRVRYGFPPNSCKKALVLAPHSDDEAIGCAGTIFQLRSLGYEVVILLFALPDDELEDGDGSTGRLQEFFRCLSHYGNCKGMYFHYPDGDLMDHFEQAKKELRKVIEMEEPGIIFTPYIMDSHSDHRCVSLLLASVLSDRDILVAMYEVWIPILYPNYYIDISQFWEQKQSALICYPSQLEQYAILEKAKELNRLRAALSMRRKVRYIEAFKGMKAQEFIRLVKVLQAEEII